jgi:hypothetical protein
MPRHLKRNLAALAVVGGVLAACGGSEVLAVISFLGSAGGDWRFGSIDSGAFVADGSCGGECRINIAAKTTQDLFSDRFEVRYSGNLPGCPDSSDPGEDGQVTGERIVLPGCFSGRYESINRVISDDGRRHAFFDRGSLDLTTGVWVEIQDGRRRFKFENDADERDTTAISGCELTIPAKTSVAMSVTTASIDDDRVATTIDSLSVGGEVWSGEFVGISGMRLRRGSQTMELQRKDLVADCS